MNANDILTRITDNLNLTMDAIAADNWQRILYSLEDGEALATLGITDDDDDQEAVEEAHSITKEKHTK